MKNKDRDTNDRNEENNNNKKKQRSQEQFGCLNYFELLK